jgi:hypothetical protein
MKESEAFTETMRVIRACYDDPMSGMKVVKKEQVVEYQIAALTIQVPVRLALVEHRNG